MAENQSELLEATIEEVRSYDQDARSPYGLEWFMLLLNDADRSQNKPLWEQLRAAFAESAQVSRKATKAFLTRHHFADQGYWWWDPREWVVPEEAETKTKA